MVASPTNPSSVESASERRSPLLELSLRQLEDALRGVLPNATLHAHGVAKSGRSNTNYLLDTSEGEFVLRVHVRDDALASKERALYEHCKKLVPLARLVGCDTEGVSVGHAFSLLEFVPGDSLEAVMAAGASERLDSALCNFRPRARAADYLPLRRRRQLGGRRERPARRALLAVRRLRALGLVRFASSCAPGTTA